MSWGSNTFGECGTGEAGQDVERRPACINAVLRQVIGTSQSIEAVACGEAYTLMLTRSGDVLGCGRAREGQLGIKLEAGCRILRQPTIIEELKHWRIGRIACGTKHSVAVSRCGRAFEWGLLMRAGSEPPAKEDAFAANLRGLGRNFQEDLDARQQRIVAASWSRYLTNANARRAAGKEAEELDCETGAVMNSAGCQRRPVWLPRPCEGLEGARAELVACGFAHTVLAMEGGELMAAGYNEKGQLGVGTRLASSSFVRVATADVCPEGSTPAMLDCGLNHTAVVMKPHGGLYTWGFGTFGQLGLGHHRKESCYPCAVDLTDAKVVQMACGDNHTVALTQQGDLYAFGHRDAVGGCSHMERLPERVYGIQRRARRIFAGGMGSFATMHAEESESAGEQPAALLAWGYNQRFQLGRYSGHSEQVRPGPTCMPRLRGTDLQALAAGTYHCVALAGVPKVSVLPPSLTRGARCFGSAALGSMLDSGAEGAAAGAEYNIALVCGAGTQVLGAHRCVLRARCPTLSSRLRPGAGVATAGGRPWLLDLLGCSVAAVTGLLEYLYCDTCSASPQVAAELRPLAQELGLEHLVAGVTAATQTETAGSGVRWARTSEGKWAQLEDQDDDAGAPVESTYEKDLGALVSETRPDDADFVELAVRLVEAGAEADGTSRTLWVARPLLATVDFFQPLLRGDFAEGREIRDGHQVLKCSTDHVDAYVACLLMLTGADATERLMPKDAETILAVLVEAHRLGLPGVVAAAERCLGEALAHEVPSQELAKAVACAAELYGFPRLLAEAEAAVATSAIAQPDTKPHEPSSSSRPCEEDEEPLADPIRPASLPVAAAC